MAFSTQSTSPIALQFIQLSWSHRDDSFDLSNSFFNFGAYSPAKLTLIFPQHSLKDIGLAFVPVKRGVLF